MIARLEQLVRQQEAIRNRVSTLSTSSIGGVRPSLISGAMITAIEQCKSSSRLLQTVPPACEAFMRHHCGANGAEMKVRREPRSARPHTLPGKMLLPLHKFRLEVEPYIERAVRKFRYVHDSSVGPPQPVTPFKHPQTWMKDINPKVDIDAVFRMNCQDCTRAVIRRWFGWYEEAAGSTGEPGKVIEYWAGREEIRKSVTILAQDLREAGHGAIAAIAYGIFSKPTAGRLSSEGTFFWETRYLMAHSRALLNFEGDIYEVDGQSGLVQRFSGSITTIPGRLAGYHERYHDGPLRPGECLFLDMKTSNTYQFHPGFCMALGWNCFGQPLWDETQMNNDNTTN